MKTSICSLAMILMLGMAAGDIVAAQDTQALTRPINHIGNQIGFQGSQTYLGLRYLGNCIAGSSVILGLALIIARKRP